MLIKVVIKVANINISMQLFYVLKQKIVLAKVLVSNLIHYDFGNILYFTATNMIVLVENLKNFNDI